ncbi:MAG: efflux transporter outer membrane subunit [Burkholderiales bacterium]|nr:efflux transporter outer membrane subunit [Burkholderiales bacterium]
MSAGRRYRGSHTALLALVLPLILASCALRLPADDTADAVAVPARWSEGAAPRAESATSLVGWWWRFGDAELSALIDDALRANPDVQSAMAALRQSRALVDVAAAGLLPSLDASTSAQRSRAGQATSNRYGVGLDARWELDLSGVTRAGVAAAQSDAQAAQMRLGDVQVSLAAEVALAWIDLRNAQTRLGIAQVNLAAQDDTTQITRWRHQAGLVSTLDVEQATTAAEQTRALVPLLETSVAQTRHRLAVLTGRPPAALATPVAAAVPLPPDDLVLAFPADTLRQRPDVRAAEAQVQAARARVAQADAAHYPSFNLAGTLGLQALTLGGLTGGGASVYSLLAGLSVPIFDGGAIAGRVDAQRAALDQANAGYRSTVLAALREVEDALVALQGDRTRSGSLQIAATAAVAADTLARQQYQAGLIDFNTVLQSQRTQLAAQDSVASARASLAANHVRLYKALGGGWSPDAIDAATSAHDATREHHRLPPST